MKEKSREEGGMIKWIGENGGELVGTNKYLCVQIRFFCRLHRDALVEAQES
jgi:hypothetical protein